MVDETTANNPIVTDVAAVQEPALKNEGLNETTEVTTEGTGKVEEQPIQDSKTTTKQEKVDLNKAIAKLSPAEQKAYKDFQADYTKKSQAAAKITEYEQYLNTLTSDPDIVAVLKAKEAKAQAAKEPDFSKMNDEEIFNYTVDKRVQSKLEELENRMESKYGSFIQNKLVSEGNKIIEDFATDKKIEVDDAKELAKYAVEHRVTMDEAYKVAYFDEIPRQAKQEALDDLNLKKQANLELGNIPSGVAPVMPERPTVMQAYEMAKRQTGIKL